MNRKELSELEHLLSSLPCEKINHAVSIKLPYDLWKYIKKHHQNVSGYLRESVVQRLKRELSDSE